MTKDTQLVSGVQTHSPTATRDVEWFCPLEFPAWCRDRRTASGDSCLCRALCQELGAGGLWSPPGPSCWPTWGSERPCLPSSPCRAKPATCGFCSKLFLGSFRSHCPRRRQGTSNLTQIPKAREPFTTVQGLTYPAPFLALFLKLLCFLSTYCVPDTARDS